MPIDSHLDSPPVTVQSKSPHRQHNFNFGQPSFWRSKTGYVTIGFLVIAAFLLLSEHRAHALGYLPFLLLPACLLFHFFMHGGHGSHGASAQNERDTKGDRL